MQFGKSKHKVGKPNEPVWPSKKKGGGEREKTSPGLPMKGWSQKKKGGKKLFTNSFWRPMRRKEKRHLKTFDRRKGGGKVGVVR